jgi:hypothetical protein
MKADSEATAQSKNQGWALVILAWLPVLIPLAWGIWQTVKKAAVLFTAT